MSNPASRRLALTRLENRTTPAAVVPPSFIPLVSGSGVGSRPLVQTYNADGTLRTQFLAFDAGFTGGVNVALADVNGDGVRDVIAAAGPGGGPHVKVFDGASVNLLPSGTTPVETVTPPALLSSFFAYDPGFTGGVSVAAGDVNGDGVPDIVTGAGPGGGPHVKAFSGATGAVLRSFFAFAPTFTGGVSVAAGRINTDTLADIVVGSGSGMTATVAAFDGGTSANFLTFKPYDVGFTGGVNVATGHITLTRLPGFDDIVTGAGPGAGPHVKVFTPTAVAINPVVGQPGGIQFTATEVSSFFAFDAGFRGGVRVATADADGDGKGDVVAGAGPGSDPAVRIFRGTNSVLLYSFLKFGLIPGTPEYTSGVTLGGRFVDVLPAPVAAVG